MTTINLTPYPTIPLMGVSGATLGYSGGLNQSLGGTKAGSPLPTQTTPYPVTGPADQYRLFPDVDARDRSVGQVTYRGLIVQNDGADLADLRVHAIQPLSNASIDFQVVDAAVLPRLASETQDPGGAFVNDMTFPATFTAGGTVGVWIRRTIPAGCAAYPLDYWILHLSAPGWTSQNMMFWHTIRSGVFRVSAVGSTEPLSLGQTEEIQIICQDCFGSPVDPGQNLLYVDINKPSNSGMPSTYPAFNPEVDTCTRTDLGVYTYTFRPDLAGFYTLRFDAGEGTRVVLERNVRP